MNLRLRPLAIAAIALVAVLLTACGGVYSSHPASDDATTRADERLIGFWSVDPGETPDGASAAPPSTTLFVVGRHPDGGSILRLVSVTLRGDEGVESTWNDLATTTVADKRFASLFLGSKDSSCVLFRYEMPDADTIRVLGMEEHAVADDVRAGRVAGGVLAPKPEAGGTESLTVTLDAATPVLRHYLAERGDGVWRLDQPLVLRRLRIP